MFLGNRNWGKTESLIPAVEVAHYSSCSKVTQRLPEGQAAKSFESDLPVPLPPTLTCREPTSPVDTIQSL